MATVGFKGLTKTNSPCPYLQGNWDGDKAVLSPVRCSWATIFRSTTSRSCRTCVVTRT